MIFSLPTFGSNPPRKDVDCNFSGKFGMIISDKKVAFATFQG
jgi:hypothetical protein